tara:strand:- start:6362 stop:6931 length:570 start_codon:yes stop_codon:yes gene_type:complete
MPQLDPAVFLPQIFWLAVLFGVLYLITTYSAVPKISAILEKRQNRIADDLEEAERLQRQAEEARAAYEAALTEARETAKARITAKREQIKAEIDAKYDELTDRLNAEAAEAEQRIAAAKAKAMAELKDVSAELCKEIVARIAHLELDPKSVAKVVEAKLADTRLEGAGLAEVPADSGKSSAPVKEKVHG